MKLAALIVGGILLVGAAVAACIYVPRWLAPAVGQTEQVIITNRGAYRVQGYEQFYDWQEEIGAVDTKLSAYPTGDLSERESVECRGLLARRANLVASYNAAARAVETTGQWQADNLPAMLDQSNPRTC